MPRHLIALAVAVAALAVTPAEADDWYFVAGPQRLVGGEFGFQGVTGSSILPLHDRLLIAAAASDGEFSRGERRLAVAELLRRVTLADAEAGMLPDWPATADTGFLLPRRNIHEQIRYLGEKLAEAERRGGWEAEPVE